MTKHIDTVISKARATLGLVKFFSRGFNNSRATKTLYCTLVRSLLEYAALVWSPVAACHINRLESIQKQFVLFALGRQRIGDSYVLPPNCERVATLGIDTIEDRHQLACVTVIHDSLLGRIDCFAIRERIATVNSNRRGRYLTITAHRTNYGLFEPINKCARYSNDASCKATL